jgi:hypothetical protein
VQIGSGERHAFGDPADFAGEKAIGAAQPLQARIAS